jgi:hypothetical protein
MTDLEKMGDQDCMGRCLLILLQCMLCTLGACNFSLV